MPHVRTILSAPVTVNAVIGLSYVLAAIALMLGGELDLLHALTPFHLRTNMLIVTAAILISIFYIAAFGRRRLLWMVPQIVLVPLMLVGSLDILDCGPNFYYCVA